MPMLEFLAVAGYSAMVNLRGQIVMLRLEELDHQGPFCFCQLGLLVHSISPAIKRMSIADLTHRMDVTVLPRRFGVPGIVVRRAASPAM
jgi:hypothetical protein